MRKLKFYIVTGLCGAWLAFSPATRAAEAGSYLNIDAGVNFVHDITIMGTEIDMDPGFRVGIAPGLILNRALALEFETGFIYNEPDGAGDEWVGHVPLMPSLILRHDFENGLTPFLGVGAGGTVSFIQAEFIETESDVTFAFAWQAQTGLRYRINDNLDLGAVYKYLGVLDPEFELFGVDFEVENVHNHFIGIQFNLDF